MVRTSSPLDVKKTGPRGHIPVDGSDVVPGAILAYLFELQSEPAESALVLARKPRLHGLAGADLEPPHLGAELRSRVARRRSRTGATEVGREVKGHFSLRRFRARASHFDAVATHSLKRYTLER
jgi:hypothetical protein